MLDISAEGVQNLQSLSMYIILCIVLINIYLLKLFLIGTYNSASLAYSGRSTCLYLAGYFRYILSAIYHPSGLLKVFRQSEENLRWISSFRNCPEEISYRTCLYLGNSFGKFLQLDLYHNYTYFRLSHLGGGWG